MKKFTQEEFIRRAILIHGDKYNYSNTKYITALTKVNIICPTHGEFEQIPASHLLGHDCIKCGFNNSSNYHRSTIEEFIQKAQQVHGDKYDYTKVIYINKDIKICIICPIHGEFWKTPHNHINGQKCPECSKIIFGEKWCFDINTFIKKSNLIHNFKYDYSKTVYNGSKIKLTIICNKHGEFNQKPSSHLSGSGCPKCKMSKGEIAIENTLKKYNIKYKYDYIFLDEKYRYKYDFYLSELNILIEFHGIQHYKWIPFFSETYEEFKERQDDDIFKKEIAKEKYIPLLEFNYKQLKELTDEQFEELVMEKIMTYKGNPGKFGTGFDFHHEEN